MSSQTVSRAFVVRNAKGLHARPATLIAKTASRFDAEVTLDKDGQAADARSVISILILAAGQGAEVQVKASGPQSDDAVQALGQLFETGFNES